MSMTKYVHVDVKSTSMLAWTLVFVYRRRLLGHAHELQCGLHVRADKLGTVAAVCRWNVCVDTDRLLRRAKLVASH